MEGKPKTVNLKAKRRSLELSHWEAWLGQGRSRFHLEHIEPLAIILEKMLQWSGLLKPGLANALSHRLIELDLTLERLPASFDGFKILYMSDLHLDALNGLAEALVKMTAGLNPDICLLGGDYRFQVKGPCHNVYPEMEKLLKGLDPPHGVLGILGNHDFAEEAEELSRMGVEMLLNRARPVERQGDLLWFVGLDDPHFYGCDDLEGALAPVPPQSCKVLAVHTPELWQEAAGRGIDLYLCGHTHGGQIRLPLIGAPLLNAACPKRFTDGFWTHGGMQGYTSRGAGSSMVPVRFNCPPEVVLITLHCPVFNIV